MDVKQHGIVNHNIFANGNVVDLNVAIFGVLLRQSSSHGEVWNDRTKK